MWVLGCVVVWLYVSEKSVTTQLYTKHGVVYSLHTAQRTFRRFVLDGEAHGGLVEVDLCVCVCVGVFVCVCVCVCTKQRRER